MLACAPRHPHLAPSDGGSHATVSHYRETRSAFTQNIDAFFFRCVSSRLTPINPSIPPQAVLVYFGPPTKPQTFENQETKWKDVTVSFRSWKFEYQYLCLILSSHPVSSPYLIPSHPILSWVSTVNDRWVKVFSVTSKAEKLERKISRTPSEPDITILADLDVSCPVN